MSETAGGAFYARPTLGRRLRWAFGYRPRFPEFDIEPEGAPHWAKTEVFIKFSLGDRLRLLLTGGVMVLTEHRTNVPVEKWVSNSAVILLGPGDYRLKQLGGGL